MRKLIRADEPCSPLDPFHFRSEIITVKSETDEKSSLHSAKFQISAYSQNQPINPAGLDRCNVHINIRRKLSTKLVFSLKTKLEHKFGERLFGLPFNF